MLYTYSKQVNKFSRVYSHPLIKQRSKLIKTSRFNELILNLQTQKLLTTKLLSVYCFKVIWLGVIRSRINMARQDHRFHIKGETVKSLGSACTCVLRDLILQEPCLGFWQNAYLFTTLQVHFANFIYRFILFFKYHLIYTFPFYFAPNEPWIILLKIWICIGFQNLNC